MLSPVRTYTPRIQPGLPRINWPSLSTFVKLPASRTFLAGDILGEMLGNNEVQILTPGGTISGGTWTITYNGQTTSALAYNAIASAIQAALELLSTVGVGNVVVTGGPISSGVVTLTFQNDLGYQNINQVTVGAGSLTGTSPTLTPSTTTQGSSGSDGTYDTYNAAGTNGTQTPKLILADNVTTDANGYVINDDGTLDISATGWLKGAFRSEDVPLMNDAILALKPGAGWFTGNAASGIFLW